MKQPPVHAFACEGKSSFPTHGDAQRVTRRSSRGRSRNDKVRVPYRCTFCRHWHLGAPKMKRHYHQAHE